MLRVKKLSLNVLVGKAQEVKIITAPLDSDFIISVNPKVYTIKIRYVHEMC